LSVAVRGREAKAKDVPEYGDDEDVWMYERKWQGTVENGMIGSIMLCRNNQIIFW